MVEKEDFCTDPLSPCAIDINPAALTEPAP